MPAAPHRLFFAVVPDAQAQLRLAAFATQLRAAHPGGGWVDPARYHATLVFLGEWAGLPDAVAARASQAAAQVRVAPFAAAFGALDAFAGPRAVWTLRGDAAPWLPLVDALHSRLDAAGVDFDRRPFVAHVTLRRARERPASRLLDAPIAWTARGFALLHSAPGRAGYATLGEWALA
jgi:2'-5' RNA ligase